ncbi:MAG: hypothetical protein MJ072_02080, partial [Clostridia bacterium]|nr:hypothetical protein [Clostridia bacterium]
QASTFDYNFSIDILVMVVLGGMGNIAGSIISAVAITFINNQLSTLLTGDMAAVKNLLYALILIVIVIYNNAPALKGVREKFDLRKFFAFLKVKVYGLFTKKKVNVGPDEQTEFGADWSKIPTKIEMDAILSTDFVADGTYVPDEPDKPRKE